MVSALGEGPRRADQCQILEYAKLEKDRASSAAAKSVLTFSYVAERYMEEVVPTKAPATQRGNARELKQLLSFFNDPPAPLEAIEPQHVRQYLRYRGKTAPVRANREKALLSAIWNFARETGYTALANPCSGVKGNRETDRKSTSKTTCFSACGSTPTNHLKMPWICFTLLRNGSPIR